VSVHLADPVQADAQATNRQFFLDHLAEYRKSLETIDTYIQLRKYVSEKIVGIGRMLDIGNGGVCNYDATRVGEIVALDLFFDQLPPEICKTTLPPNAQARTGSALDIPEPDESFDGVLMVMLIHHLVGSSVADCKANARRAIQEASRVLKPGGRFILVESCVPRWFYRTERLAYRGAVRIIPLISSHPPTLQYVVEDLRDMVSEFLPKVEVEHMPRGRKVVLYGITVPSAFTPVQVHILVGHKEASRAPGR